MIIIKLIIIIILIIIIDIFYLQVAKSPSELRFEANLSNKDSLSSKHSQKSKKVSYREDTSLSLLEKLD